MEADKFFQKQTKASLIKFIGVCIHGINYNPQNEQEGKK